VTRQPFKPRDYQRAMISHAYMVDRGALWAGMGLGKTVSALTMLDALQLVYGEPTLVLAPLRVAQSTWPDEAAKWDHLKATEVVPVVGTPRERRAALARPGTVYTTNYENIEWLIAELGDRWPFTTVVADESTRLKNFRLSGGGVRARALGRVAHKKVKRWLNLTGTPSPNGLIDLWGQQWFIDWGQRLGVTIDDFRQRWFRPLFADDTGRMTWVPLPSAQASITAKLRDVCLSLEAGDYFDLPQLVNNTVYVDMPGHCRVKYRELERDMYTQLDSGHEVEAFNAATRTLKCLQFASGALYTDDGTTDDSRKWIEVHDLKLQALQSIINEAAGEPVLVAYHFRSDLTRLRKAFPKGVHLGHDPQTIRDWNAGKIPVLFAHPESAGHGLNLQDGGRHLAFFSHWWALEPYQQIIERIGPTRQAQSGHPRTVYVHHIVARGTVDELVMRRRETKATVQALLMEGMKRARR